MQVMWFAVEKYLNRASDRPELTADEVRERFGLSELMLRKVAELVARAIPSFGATSAEPRLGQLVRWTFTISRDVRPYRQAATIADFIHIYEQLRDAQRQQAQSAHTLLAVAPTGTVDAVDISEAAAAATVSVPFRPISLFPLEPVTRNDNLCFVLMPFAETLRPV